MSTHAQSPVTQDMYLRLAFLRKQEIDTMKPTPAKREIRKTKMIGPVSVEGLVGDPTVKVDSAQFQTLSDPAKRNGGTGITAPQFRALKEALQAADWIVDRKYLAKRNREGQNGHWTPAQVQIIVDAVEGKSGIAFGQQMTQCYPRSVTARDIHTGDVTPIPAADVNTADSGKRVARSYIEAANFLKRTFSKSHGYDWNRITKDKVRHVYERERRQLEQPSTSKVGRPRLLSEECESALKDFVKATLDGDTSYMLCYYMDRFEQILTEYKEVEAFYDGCKDPTRYLRAIIRQQSGAPRQVTTYSGKELSNEDRLKSTTDNFLRLAYLVRQYGLTEYDVYNFDETAVRFHEDATGKVIARKGTNVVKGEAFQGSVDHRLCCTFIPMVSCAGEKFDPALIFKGKKGLTGAIPGDGGKAFQSLYDPEGIRKVCFMQNDGKWSTNQTMTQWFTEHFIPQVHAAKQARVADKEVVPDKYVVILDGVATHCMSGEQSESWITKVQAADPNLILLWLPPNMTGDLQPLDVNFNWPFKARYKPELARLKMRQKAAQPAIQQQNGTTPRGDSAAQKLKEVVIKAIISAYKLVPKDQTEKGWTNAGKYVYEDNKVSGRPAGYHSAWDPETQDEAVKAFEAGTLFHDGMKGGVSVVEGPRFIPKAGNKKKEKPTEDATGRVLDGGQEARNGRKKKGPKKLPIASDGSNARGTGRDENVELARPRRRGAGENPHYQDYVDTTEAVQASVQEDAAASSQRYPEHDYSQYLDEFVDSEGEEDEIIEALSDRPVGGETPTQT
jgi:hypothetical protein